ncbi:MAG: hypothetical protein HXX13_06620 [Bacteroidetes bacterium]|nr:hypothetical protein [Bacteroidota bacterium]
MNRARPLAIYALITGSFLLGLWVFFLVNHLIPEVSSRPTESRFHIAVELCTSLMLIISGIRVLYTKGQGEGMLLMSIGMLFYTLLNTSGYYAEKASVGFITIFVLLLITAIYLTWQAFHGTQR